MRKNDPIDTYNNHLTRLRELELCAKKQSGILPTFSILSGLHDFAQGLIMALFML